MNSTKFIKMLMVLLISLFCLSYSYAGDPKAKPFIPDIPKEWTKITPGPTQFMGKNLVPTCSGYPTTNPTFSFFVKGGTVNNVVVYFQGGGACWDWTTCISNPVFYPDVTDGDNPAYSPYGMFDLSNPDNPFKDWTFVFIPYCTGDIHWGSNDYQYVNPTNPNIKVTIHHRGHDNFLVVLKWITENIKKPHDIFVTGSSAGSYGALHGFPWLNETYPQSHISLLGDAGMGVSPQQFNSLQKIVWNTQYPEWIFGQNPPNTTPELWRGIADYYPHSKVAEFTDAWDLTQIFFYDLILQTFGLPHFGSCVAWNSQMITGVDYKQESPNYRSYIAAGTVHTILGRPQFYTEGSAGLPLLDWLNAMVDNQGGTNRHGAIPWINLECVNCAPPTTCPY
jgi:hypothetical protein